MWISRSTEETIRLGESFGTQYIRMGTIVCVRGELGAGKTHFIKGIAHSFGIDEREITSPTFALLNEYETATLHLNHLDCYRFQDPKELLELGVEDYFYPPNGATIIEWPERIENLLPRERIEVTIEVLSPTERRIT